MLFERHQRFSDWTKDCSWNLISGDSCSRPVGCSGSLQAQGVPWSDRQLAGLGSCAEPVRAGRQARHRHPEYVQSASSLEGKQKLIVNFAYHFPVLAHFAGDYTLSEMLVAMSATTSLEEFYPAAGVTTLMRILKDPSLSMHHSLAMQGIGFLFKGLGIKCVPFLPQVMPTYLAVIENPDTDAPFREVRFDCAVLVFRSCGWGGGGGKIVTMQISLFSVPLQAVGLDRDHCEAARQKLPRPDF